MGTSVEPRATVSAGAIDFDHISHAFLQHDAVVRAVEGIKVTIPAGQFVSIVGPSGCGKTTLLSMAAGLLEPGRGQVSVDGLPAGDLEGDVAYMLARDALLPWRSARGNVELGLQVRGVPAKERRARAQEWLKRVRLEGFSEARVNQLSQGMRQRVAIARTLAQEPRITLMDEPFAALDAQTRALVHQEFLDLWEQRPHTVILVTHDLEEAILLSDRVLVMSNRPGSIVMDAEIQLPHPRQPQHDRVSTEFAHQYERLWACLKSQFSDPRQAAETGVPA